MIPDISKYANIGGIIALSGLYIAGTYTYMKRLQDEINENIKYKIKNLNLDRLQEENLRRINTALQKTNEQEIKQRQIFDYISRLENDLTGFRTYFNRKTEDLQRNMTTYMDRTRVDIDEQMQKTRRDIESHYIKSSQHE
jgi:glutamate synthase domain-containing protein 2